LVPPKAGLDFIRGSIILDVKFLRRSQIPTVGNAAEMQHAASRLEVYPRNRRNPRFFALFRAFFGSGRNSRAGFVQVPSVAES
jgi:hypothetical protein